MKEGMTMRLRLSLHRTQGQSVIVVALALVLLVGMAGLGLDGANAFNRRRNAANAADAAVMAGANTLIAEQRKDPLASNGATAVRDAVAEYLDDHGIDPSDANNSWTAYYVDSAGTRLGAVNNSGQINTSARGISIDVRNTFNTWFMGVLGRSTLTVGGASTAIFGKKKLDGGDILPITMSEDAAEDMENNEGTEFVFGPSSGAFKVNPGNFGAVSLDPDEDDPNATGNNADCTNPSSPEDNPSYWWCNGTPHDISVGDWLYGDPGEIAANLVDEIDYRLTTNPYGLVPVYDTTNCEGAVDPLEVTPDNPCGGNNARYRVVGFLVVKLTEYHLPSNPKTISAEYVDYVSSTGAIDPNSPVTGLYAINLIKTPGTLQ
jgi:Flp pilus assembly protein TadG